MKMIDIKKVFRCGVVAMATLATACVVEETTPITGSELGALQKVYEVESVADMLHIEQRTHWKRLVICAPLFAAGIALTFINFDVVWRYFAWTNQALATVVLWCIVVYLFRHKCNYYVALLPAIFMTYICSSFVFVSNQFVGLGATPMAYIGGAILALALSAIMCYKLYSDRKKGLLNN